MNVLDLFSGIGGFSLGLERAGMRTVAFCEIDPYCRRVLARHWPDVPVYDDVRTLTASRLVADARHRQPQECASVDGLDQQRSQERRRAEQPTGTGAGSRVGNGDTATRTNGHRAVATGYAGIDVIAGGFPQVKISAQQARAPALPASAAAYGASTPELLARYDRDTSSWRTSQHCFIEGLETFSETWPRSGIVVAGTCVPASAVGAPHRRETEYGS